ncbi:MAG TPA: amidohydrolase family protein [Candidatus Saccharimonadales bacterium]|jgi:L-fuconolactonase|nr:amidohydrolase family protein [Candidatus Saccharimonadales bacterium]
MKIDSHQHFWRYDAVRDTWITDSMAALRRDFVPDNLSVELKANGMEASIAVQADPSENETKFLLDLAEKNSRVAGVVGWVDFLSSRIGERLEYFSHFSKLRGFRHIAQAEPDDGFLVRDDFVKGVAQLRPFGFTYDILIYPRQLPAAIELVAALPEQNFVIDHCAKPEVKSGKILPWATHIKEIAQNRNVFCKVSGLVTEADWKRWKADDFKPYLDVVFDAFGAERLMFGSDWPVCLLAATYRQVMQLLEDYAKGFSLADKDKIFGGNAARFYRLKTAQHGLAA